MEITPPYGYRDITPFLRDHRIRDMTRESYPEFFRRCNAMPVTLTEVPRASLDYPVAFTPTGDGKNHILIAVLGMVEGENLYTSASGWAAGTYIPAYVRRYPFCMTRVRIQEIEQSQRIVCIEKDYIAADGVAYFDDAGNPGAKWTEILAFLNEYEGDFDRTQEVCQIISDLKLLEPMTMQANVGEQNFNLTGMLRIDEKRLDFLTSNEVKTLIRKRAMGVIYQHLASLARFGRLVDIKAARINASKTAPAINEGKPA